MSLKCDSVCKKHFWTCLPGFHRGREQLSAALTKRFKYRLNETSMKRAVLKKATPIRVVILF